TSEPGSPPMRSPAWRRACDSPVPNHSQRRSLAGSRPGRTGSSCGPTRPGRRGPCAGTAPGSGPSSIRNESDMADSDIEEISLTGPAPQPDGRVSVIDYSERIPNNVGLAPDRKLQRALESWQPAFRHWWAALGPSLPTRDVYLRTAVAIGRDGWASWARVPME